MSRRVSCIKHEINLLQIAFDKIKSQIDLIKGRIVSERAPQLDAANTHRPRLSASRIWSQERRRVLRVLHRYYHGGRALSGRILLYSLDHSGYLDDKSRFMYEQGDFFGETLPVMCINRPVSADALRKALAPRTINQSSSCIRTIKMEKRKESSCKVSVGSFYMYISMPFSLLYKSKLLIGFHILSIWLVGYLFIVPSHRSLGILLLIMFVQKHVTVKALFHTNRDDLPSPCNHPFLSKELFLLPTHDAAN